jgi:hypothetical protein
MHRSLLALPAIAALSLGADAQLAFGSAELTTLSRVSAQNLLISHIEGATGAQFGLFASLDENFQGHFYRLGVGVLDVNGDGALQVALPDPDSLPANLRVHFRAAYVDGATIRVTQTTTVLFHPVPAERIDFTWHPDGQRIAAGERIAEQWAALGVHIVVDTHHATNAPAGIALDSTAPGPFEGDLATPGSGPGNRRGLDNLLVVAADMFDGDFDELVDQPGAEQLGGVVEFRFDQPTYLDRLTLVDVDAAGGRMRCFMGPDMVADLPIEPMGDGSAQVIGFPYEAVTRLRVNLKCAAAIGELSFLPCPEEVDFDHTMTGIPLGLASGEVIGEQLRASNGVRFRFDTHHGSNPSLGVLVPLGSGLVDVEGNPLAEARVLAVAADPTDANSDGLLDAPAAEPMGGAIVIDFDFDVRWTSARVADVNAGEPSHFLAFDQYGNVLATYPLASLGAGVVQTVQPDLGGVRRIRLVLRGSAYLVGLEYCAEDQFPGNTP